METAERISQPTTKISTITTQMEPKVFIYFATKHPGKIKRSKFVLPKKFGHGFKAKILVEFENGQ
jgi:hypothetical protein